MTDGSLSKQRFSGGQSRLLILPLVLDQREETVEYWPGKPGACLLGNLLPLSRQRQGKAAALAGYRQCGAARRTEFASRPVLQFALYAPHSAGLRCLG